ncbi:MAG: potassium-transporting ATPase subunit KdpA [Rickettsiales bacterium]
MEWFNDMPANGVAQILIYFAALLALAKPLGGYMAKIYGGDRHPLLGLFGFAERGIYRLAGIHPDEEMGWRQYALSIIYFSAGGFILLFLILSLQKYLPLNPEGLNGLDPDLAFGTAASFVSNTNWQAYSGEAVMSYFSQMAGLTVQNFLSAAIGMAAAAAFIRGLARKNSATIGNFWVDLVRTNLYVLIPLSVILALALASQGVVQTFDRYKEAQLLEPIVVTNGEGKTETVTTQTIAVGPAASQVAIKQLGTNGGGFFNANSAHPLENPNAASNFLELLAILLIPAAFCHTFGRMVGDARQGWAVLAAMTVIFIPFLLFSLASEQAGNPHLDALGITQEATDLQPGGNMEGKEARFGVANSVLWESATTAASNGSVNSMHDSYTPLGGLSAFALMQFGEVIYGGVGSGLYGMLIFALIAVFIAGLMVGRTPEYLGKKIQVYEIKMASIAILFPCGAVLLGTAAGVLTEAGVAGLQEHGAHGFSEILYAFTSAGMNNGSAFGGLSADSYFYNTLQGLAMLFGRYWVMIPALAIAGSLAAKKTVPISAGTLPTHTPMFIALLASVVVMVGLLTFVPALILGPVAEFIMTRG